MIRRIKHIIKSGCFFRGIEHFLVMFPSALIIASITNTRYGEPVFSLSSILMSVGISTIAFLIFTKGKIPFFLGPSFSYIGFTSYYVATISDRQDIQYVRATILWGYLLSIVILICLSFLYHFKITGKIVDFLFPSVVMGPAISLIGLELANTAISDAGLNGTDYRIKILAILTLVIIIIASLTKRRFFKNTSIFLGIIMGCIIASFMGMFKLEIPDNKLIIFPTVYINEFLVIPDNLGTLFISVIPSTVMNFTELIGRVTVLDGMQKRDGINDEGLMSKSLKKSSISNFISVLIASVPCTFYAENIAIMNLNSSLVSVKGSKMQDEDRFVQNCYNPYSVYPYVIASIVSILVACIGWLQNIFMCIPKAVLGSMELFVFTLVASPGIQLLVENKVDYKKISNQIISASILLAGVSSLVIEYKTIYLKGMSLGLTIGVTINLITRILYYFGWLNENLTLLEILELCVDCNSHKIHFWAKKSMFFSEERKTYTGSEIIELIHKKIVYSDLKDLDSIEITETCTNKKIVIKQAYNQIMIVVAFPVKLQKEYANDYNFVVPIDKHGRVQIVINTSVSKHKLCNLLKNIT